MTDLQKILSIVESLHFLVKNDGYVVTEKDLNALANMVTLKNIEVRDLISSVKNSDNNQGQITITSGNSIVNSVMNTGNVKKSTINYNIEREK